MKKLLDFYADWCQPCKAMAPIIEELEKELPDLEVVKIDIDKEEQLVEQYGVMSVPTYIVLEDDEILHQFVGAVSKGALLEALQ